MFDEKYFKNACKILKIKPQDNLNKIRNNFKKLALKYHPDKKQGNSEYFQQIKNAYSYLYKIKTEELQNKKKQNRTMSTYRKERKMPNIYNQNITTRNFNEQFEKNRIKDAYDEGRLDFLNKDNSKIKLPVAIIKKPKLLQNSIMNNCRQLDIQSIDDFSSFINNKTNNSNQISCFDIKYAYENKESIDSVKNIEKYTKNSDNLIRNPYAKNLDNDIYKLQNQRKKEIMDRQFIFA